MAKSDLELGIESTVRLTMIMIYIANANTKCPTAGRV
jgi:hypothetical protein